MRISDWSSDVCSSDLVLCAEAGGALSGGAPRVGSAQTDDDRSGQRNVCRGRSVGGGPVECRRSEQHGPAGDGRAAQAVARLETGSATCRERVGQYVEILVVGGT